MIAGALEQLNNEEKAHDILKLPLLLFMPSSSASKFHLALIFILAVSWSVLFVEREKFGRLLFEQLGTPEVAALVAGDAGLLVEIGNYYLGVDDSGAYDLERAEMHFQRALELDPQVPDAWHQLARISFLRGDFNEALERIDKQLDIHSDDLMASYYIRGLIHGFAGNFEQAEADFKTFLEWDSQNWAAWNDLAWVYFTQGKFKEMEAATRKGLAVDPQSPWLLLMHGVALMNLDEEKAAREELLAAKRHAALTTPFIWERAYPGNDPRVAGSGLEQMRASIEYNLKLLVNN